MVDVSRDSLNHNGFELKAVTTMGNQVVTTIENASLYGYSPIDGRLSQISHFKTVQPPRQYDSKLVIARMLRNELHKLTKSLDRIKLFEN